MWRAVTMELRVPYFLIAHAIKDSGAWLYETCLLWREADVEDFCKEVGADPNRKIVQLSMLLPADDLGRWDMQELKEVWSVGVGQNPEPPVFIAHDGRQLSRAGHHPPAVATTPKDRVYARPNTNIQRSPT